MSSIIQTIVQNLPLLKPVDKLISSSRSGTELRAFIKKFRIFVDDIQTAITDLDQRIENATQVTYNIDGSGLSLPGEIQRDVTFKIESLQVMNPDAPSGGGTYPQPPTEYWDDSVNAVEFFVDTTGGGSDSNDGLSELTPFATIEKALEVLKTKKISWNWNTYLRIKGTVQAPLNLDGLFSHADNFIEGPELYFSSWEDGAQRWTFEINGDLDYGYGSAIVNNNEKLTLVIDDADILIEDVFYIQKGAVSLNNGVKLIPGTDTGTFPVIICNATVMFAGITWDMSNVSEAKAFRVQGTNAIAYFYGLHSWENGDYNNSFYISAEEGAIVDTSSYSGTGLKKSVLCDSLSTVKLPANNNIVLKYLDGGNIISGYGDHRRTATTLFFPTLEDGRYMLAYSPNKGRLIEWKLSAESGTGTFNIDANGSLLQSTVTQNFTNFAEVAEQVLNFDSPWTYAYRFFLNVSSATNLTNVTIQLLWEPHTTTDFQ